MSDDKRLYLIDATALCYRAFYALKELSTSFGQPTNAIYGFLNMLNKILKEHKPDYLGICFDVSRDTFRQKKFAEYKIQRPPMPEGLCAQIPLIKEIICAYGLAIFEKQGYEADDIIATIAQRLAADNLEITIVSSDKDMLQLVGKNIKVFSPYKDEGLLYDDKKVEERFGISSGAIPELIALMGDDADNIPGVPGIGEKTAVELLKNFGSLERLLGSLEQIKQEKIKNAIKNNLDTIRLNKELAVLDKGIDLDFDLKRLEISSPNFKELYRLFKYLEFKAMLKELPVEKTAGNNIEAEEIRPDELIARVKDGDVLILYLDNLSEMAFCLEASGNKFFRLQGETAGIKKILENPKIKKISHDLKKLKVSLAKQGLGLEGLYFDTMLAAYLLNPSKSEYNLNSLAWDYLEELISAESLSAVKAADLIARLRPRLQEKLEESSLFGLFNDLDMPLVEVLSGMEIEGIRLDTALLKELSADLEKRLIKLIEEIYQISGTEFNINSPKQLRQILFEKLKLPVVKKSKTGPSTDEGVLRALADKHNLPALLLLYRQLTKLKNTYIDPLPALVDPRTERIHTSFNQAATETGRLSSSNPNLQNIPVKTDIGSKIRQAIIAFDKGSLLLSCDYSQIELRILAHLSKDKNLISAFKENKDIHRATASLIYGVEEIDVQEPMREVAKRVNFGIVYGLSAFGLSRDLGISQEAAQGFIDAYFLRYPAVKEYIQEQIKKAERDGFVTTILNRRRYIPQINHKNQGIKQFAQRQAVNTPIQGSASDLIKLAMLGIHSRIKEKGLKSRMIMQIHDELVFNLCLEEKDSFIALVKERMENVLKLDVPVRVDIKMGQNWREIK